MTSFVPLDEAISRKRKQETSNFDSVYPTSSVLSHPSNLSTGMEQSYSFGVDPLTSSFDHFSAMDNQTQLHQLPQTEFFYNGAHSRRHSVAVGEMDYHYSAFNNNNINSNNNNNIHYGSVVKQESSGDINWGNTNYNLLLGGDQCPSFSPYSSRNSLDQAPVMPHQRTMSLRLENVSPSSYDRRMSYSPTTPVFFSPTFLDSLSMSTEEDGNSFANQSFVGSVSSVATNGDGYTGQHFATTTTTTVSDGGGVSSDFMVHLDQLAMQPSVTPNTTNQQHHQQQQQSDNWMMESSPRRQSISKRRASTFKFNKSPPPASPTTTTTPSPPVTPSQHINTFDLFHHTHPSIPEEEDDTMRLAVNNEWTSETQDEAMERRITAERRAKNSLISARIINGENSAEQLKPLIQQYLLSNDPSACGEHSITLLTGKVAQKSYGTEKRFLCPPPTTILSGASWWTTRTDDQDSDDMTETKFLMSSSSTTGEILSAPKLTIHISGESTSQKGVLEWCDANGSVIDNTPSLANAANTSILGQSTISGKCVSKQLHINDADEKRRRVELLVKIQLGNGLNLGTLPSKGIKVISKPSKKRQSSKNTELCIHHGSTVSLFNRIRSQTVSTKYLGVANGDPSSNGNTGTCFTARTNSWDPFVIWIVDTTRSPDSASSTPPQLPHHPLNPEFPPPPAVALQSGMNQQSPIVIHYNQAVVLQCVSTGLVSPVMVIRKVDRGSAVLGGNCMEDLSGLTGGECGDEALGDPVSQLHKIAFQIVHDTSVAYNNKMNYHQRSPPMSTTGWTLPQTTYTISYLACLNDVVGMHKTTTERTFVSTRPPTSPTAAPSQWSSDVCATQSVYNADLSDAMSCVSQIESIGKVVRKRRVSCDVGKPSVSNNQRRRVNSLSDIKAAEDGGRRGSFADRRGSVSSDNGNPVDGNCWTEDVSDAAVWTIMGTEAVKYTFWTPPPTERDNMAFNNPFACPQQSHPITPFPIINSIASPSSSHKMLISGDNLTRDLSVWFGDIKAPLTEYKSRELLSCTVPDISDLTCSVVATTDDKHSDLMKLPILLVRGDGVVYRTDNFYSF